MSMRFRGWDRVGLCVPRMRRRREGLLGLGRDCEFVERWGYLEYFVSVRKFG